MWPIISNLSPDLVDEGGVGLVFPLLLSEGFLRCSANKYLHCVFPLDSLITCYILQWPFYRPMTPTLVLWRLNSALGNLSMVRTCAVHAWLGHFEFQHFETFWHVNPPDQSENLFIFINKNGTSWSENNENLIQKVWGLLLRRTHTHTHYSPYSANKSFPKIDNPKCLEYTFCSMIWVTGCSSWAPSGDPAIRTLLWYITHCITVSSLHFPNWPSTDEGGTLWGDKGYYWPLVSCGLS